MSKETKWAICSTCDINCGVLVTVEDGKVKSIKKNPDHPLTPNSICVKGANANKYITHPDRLTHALKRVGERGSGQWKKISTKQALDEIADKMKQLIAEDGPETIGSTYGWSSNAGAASRRFMNLLGSPNWTWTGYVCLANSTVPSKATYGFWQFPDFENTKCIVLLGHAPGPQRWTAEYLWIKGALERGAKLIVTDPRRNSYSDQADIFLQVKPATDSAYLLAWINVIIEEKLYDKEFVEKWTVGFEQLAERVKEYTPEWASEITRAPADKIREAARMYATNGPAVIPWGAVPDHHANSTQTLRTLTILRSITGNLDVPGGELLMGYHPGILSDDEFELNDRLPVEQRRKMLGIDRFKLLSWETLEKTGPHMERVWGKKYSNQISGGAMAHPASMWEAMKTGKPYRMRALISQCNNTLNSYPNTTHVYEGLMNLDLLVVMDLIKSPTAQLADYILPATHWLERPNLFNYWDWIPVYQGGEQAVEAPGECLHDWMLWRELGVRLGQEKDWPWESMEEAYDERLKPAGLTWEKLSTQVRASAPEITFKKYEQTGFGTPSGKVELYSSIFEELGYDPMPSWVEPPESHARKPELAKTHPLTFFTGMRENYWFHSFGLGRSTKELRSREPDPRMQIHPDTAYELDLSDGDWAWVESTSGKRIKLRSWLSNDTAPDVVRVPHGWWYPETTGSEEPGAALSSLWKSADAVILHDSDEYCDKEQGNFQLRGLACKVYKVEDGTEGTSYIA
ncbi:MAG: hypothetical protein RL737_980 [Bacteroidota bacterium]|jgi:anaerobic selenocysteine-containing dehydrogenase